MKAVLRPLPDYRTILPAVLEIEARLLEETQYRRESENMAFFRSHLNMDRILVPAPYDEFSTDAILSEEYMEGVTLNEWLKTETGQKNRDRVAQTLQDLFLSGLYRLHCIHADPNPGNFIIKGDTKMGLVDFGCVKRFDPEFVTLYGELPKAALHGERADYIRLLKALKIAGPAVTPNTEERMFKVFHEIGQWLGRLYREEVFDFETNPDFIASGKKMMAKAFELRKHVDLNTNFIFLHRTRYGLLRLFERMGARIRFRNPFEYS